MSAPARIRVPRGTLAEPPHVSASTAKNAFGRILDRVAREGRLAITKHDRPCAVLISIEEYRALAGAEQVTLDTLSEEFDALFERMQEPGATAAMQSAFALTPAEFGRAAVTNAARESGHRARSATVSTAAHRAGAAKVSTAKPARRARGSTPASVHGGGTAAKPARRARG